MWCSVYIIGLFLATALGSEEDLRRIDSIVQEDPCRRAGGICTLAGDCPKGQMAQKAGLCPQQRTQGVECCHGVSEKETRCGKHGGHCMPSNELCNPRLVFKEATDCPETHKCCILTV